MSGMQMGLLAAHSVGVRDGGDINANSTGGLTLNTDGSSAVTGIGAVSTNWFFPTTASIGNSYWVRATRLSGTSTSVSNGGVWLALSSARAFAATGGAGFCNVQLEFATDSGGVNIVSSYTMSVNNTA